MKKEPHWSVSFLIGTEILLYDAGVERHDRARVYLSLSRIVAK